MPGPYRRLQGLGFEHISGQGTQPISSNSDHCDDRYADRTEPEHPWRAPRVRGKTWIPVRILMDHLEAGDRLDGFLMDYPIVSWRQAVALVAMV